MASQPSFHAPDRLAGVARRRFVEVLCEGMPALDKGLLDLLGQLVTQIATYQVVQQRRDAWVHYQAHHRDWAENTARAWRNAAMGSPLDSRRGPIDDPQALDGLELVSDEVVENRLLATRLARGIEQKAETVLEAVRLRTKHLQGREVAGSDVLQPRALCLILVEQWLAVHLSRGELETVFDALSDMLADMAVPAYEAVAQLYDEQNVPTVATLRAQVRRPAGHGDGSHGRSSGAAGLSPSGAGTVPVAPQPSGYPGVGVVPPMGAPASYGWSPLEQVRQRAEQVMLQLQHLLGQSAAVGIGTGVQAPPATAALTQALASMRVQADSYYSGLARMAPGFMPQTVVQVASEVRERSVELKKSASTASEKAIIEVVALMFQSILDEDRIPPSIRVWFARLQVPVLRVALADPAFFSNLEHPARKLIDRMGSCVLGFDASAVSGGPLEAEIRRVVQVIEQYPETGHRVFQIVYEEFEKFLAKSLTQTQKTSRIVSVAQQMEQKETLTVQYTIELRTMLHDMPVRDEVREFLFKTWAEVIAMAAVRYGPQHMDTIAYKRIAADLVWASSAKPNRAERTRVIQLLPGILERLRKGLALIGIEGERQEAQVKELTDTLAEAFLSKTATISQARIDALARRLADLEEYITDESLGDIALNPENIEMLLGIDVSSIHVIADTGAPVQPQMLDWAQALPIGAWFTLDHNGGSTRVQYVWQSQRKQLHLFAAPGEESYLFQVKRLAAYLQARLLVGQEAESLTVRATRDALGKLNANPERLLG